MGEEKKKDNPGHISLALCEAYRETLTAEINGIRNTIIVGLSISTAIITLLTYVLSIGGS